MSETRPTVLKIGGSVITDKKTELSARTQVIDRLADEIERSEARQIILIHGGGSFGHPVAQRHAIRDGFKTPSQLTGFAETHYNMTLLNGLVMDSLITHNLPAVSIMPSSCTITENGRISHIEDSPLKMLLNLGFLPVLHGDVVMDKKLGFTVLSGDQLAAALAMRLNAERVIMGVDVDGLYDADPPSDGSPRPLPRLTLNQLKRIQGGLGKSTATDVTGGMAGKMMEIVPVIERGVSVILVNATKPNYIYKAMRRERIDGTLIEKA